MHICEECSIDFFLKLLLLFSLLICGFRNKIDYNKLVEIVISLFYHNLLRLQNCDCYNTFSDHLLSKQVYENTEVKKRAALSSPYGKWVTENLRSLKPVNFLSATVMDNEAILRRQQ